MLPRPEQFCLIASNLPLFSCECVFISVRGRAAISCCTFALQRGHSGVSQQCVGTHREITHIPTCGAAPYTLNSWIYTENQGVKEHFLAPFKVDQEWEKDIT